jgi:hypothetical protein
MAQSKETQKANTIGDDPKIPQVKFKDLYTSYVVPYSINQGIAKDVDINYPVYIKLGFLLLALNHMCTIYDSPDGSTVIAKNQTPLVYIDFNTETNFCLSEPLQMSTDPLKILIPFRGSDDEYSKLFDPKLIENGKIKPVSGSSKELFKPQSQDYLSSQLPEFKGINRDDGDAYSGNIMNILLNTDYILSLCKNFANNDASQSVKLRPFLQQIIDDLNKYLGGINLFRLAYDDKSNCLYIVDDQVQPMKLNEKPIPNVGRVNSEIPVFGKYSIARSLEIRTDISSKLSNMIAISANSQIKSDSSKDGTPFGHFNENYTDRLIPQVVSINASNNTPNNGPARDINDAELAAANAFNEYVKCALNTGQISDHNVSAATNYYIERMNKRKGEYPGTRASAMIPLSVNFSTDGISGLAIGHAFLLPKEVLPASYERESDSSSESILGFVVTGLNHSLQNNTWITEVKANMMYLKDKRDFVAAEKTYNVKELSTGNFVIVSENIGNYNGGAAGSGGSTNYLASLDRLPDKATFTAEIEKLAREYNTSPENFYRIMQAESGIRPNIVNSIGATGLIQFMPSTARALGTTTDTLKNMTATEQSVYVRKFFKSSNLPKGATIYDMYAVVFFPAMVSHLDNDNWIIETSRLSAELISKQNPAIARAAGKSVGTPLNVGDFKKYVNSIA